MDAKTQGSNRQLGHTWASVLKTDIGQHLQHCTGVCLFAWDRYKAAWFVRKEHVQTRLAGAKTHAAHARFENAP